LNGEDVQGPLYLQLLGTRRVAKTANDVKERYRVVISDGEKTHPYALIATELNHMYEANLLTDFTILRVDRFIATNTSGSDK